MSTSAAVVPHRNRQLAEEISRFYADPLGFVRFAFPWGMAGTPLASLKGPDRWQADLLRDIGAAVKARKFDGQHPVAPIRIAVSSGHGIGKSTISAWLACWILSTRPYSQGTVTANTMPQLATKTWAAIQRWLRLCLTADWFDVTSERVRAKVAPESWFLAALSSQEEKSEAFAGQHAAGSTSWYLFDEASAIPDAIWDVAEGGLTDGEPMIFAWGNPTRTSGRFHQACFGSQRDRWQQRIIDSRECQWPNKDVIAEWVQEYGEDSDFVRVRVRGLPPRASDAQFISSELVYEAQRRPVEVLEHEPLLCGLDVARGGGDECVFWFRRGMDARSIAPVRLIGEDARDSMRLVSLAADVLGRTYQAASWPDREPVSIAMLFIDETGIGGPIRDRLAQLGFTKRLMGVQFGAKAPDEQMENMRAYMWSRMRTWLEHGSLPALAQLEADLTGVGYAHTKRDRLVLESKESMKRRGLASPDFGDALALTFASPLAIRRALQGQKPQPRPMFSGQPSAGTGWMS